MKSPNPQIQSENNYIQEMTSSNNLYRIAYSIGEGVSQVDFVVKESVASAIKTFKSTMENKGVDRSVVLINSIAEVR